MANDLLVMGNEWIWIQGNLIQKLTLTHPDGLHVAVGPGGCHTVPPDLAAAPASSMVILLHAPPWLGSGKEEESSPQESYHQHTPPKRHPGFAHCCPVSMVLFPSSAFISPSLMDPSLLNRIASSGY